MHLTWSNLERLIGILGRKITADGFKPDYIVGVAAGGLVPLYCLSKSLGLESILTVTARSYTGTKRGKITMLHFPDIDAQGKHVLLVDEIADTGKSLKHIVGRIKKEWKPNAVKTAVLYMNTDACSFVPDYVAARTTKWIRFPWEEYERTHATPRGRRTHARRPVAYIASDCGFSGDKREYYKNTFLPMVRESGFDILDPWAMAPTELPARIQRMRSEAGRVQAWKRFNRIVGTTNTDAIRACDVVVAVLNGPDVDSGVSSEIGFAAAHGVPVFGLRDDIRLTGDNSGCLINLQVEHFATMNGGNIYTSCADLNRALVKFARSWG